MTNPFKVIHRVVLPYIRLSDRLGAGVSEATGTLEIVDDQDSDRRGLRLTVDDAIIVRNLLDQYIDAHEGKDPRPADHHIYLVEPTNGTGMDECDGLVVVAPDEETALKFADDKSGFVHGKIRVVRIGTADGLYQYSVEEILTSFKAGW